MGAGHIGSVQQSAPDQTRTNRFFFFCSQHAGDALMPFGFKMGRGFHCWCWWSDLALSRPLPSVVAAAAVAASDAIAPLTFRIISCRSSAGGQNNRLCAIINTGSTLRRT